jgi:Flp pilus assembly protein TadG
MDRGAAAVEMALVLPLLLMLVFGIIDFGRVLNKQISVTAAAQEAARVVSFGGTEDERNARAEAIAGTDIVVTGDACSAGLTGDADVTVTNEFKFVTPVGLIGGGFDGEITLTGRGVMPCQ